MQITSRTLEDLKTKILHSIQIKRGEGCTSFIIAYGENITGDDKQQKGNLSEEGMQWANVYLNYEIVMLVNAEKC